jgi:hypothetical protein
LAISTMSQKSSFASPGGSIRLASELHHAIGVGDGADLFGPRGRRQHDIGEIRCLGQEDVLHDNVVKRRHRLTRVNRRRDRTSPGSHP